MNRTLKIGDSVSRNQGTKAEQTVIVTYVARRFFEGVLGESLVSYLLTSDWKVTDNVDLRQPRARMSNATMESVRSL